MRERFDLATLLELLPEGMSLQRGQSSWSLWREMPTGRKCLAHSILCTTPDAFLSDVIKTIVAGAGEPATVAPPRQTRLD